MEDNQKLQLIIQSLQERIGQIVSQYETQNAVLIAEIKSLQSQLQAAETSINVPQTSKAEKAK